VSDSLAQALGRLSPLIRRAFGDGEEPVLAELGGLYSTCGAARQPLHADTARAPVPSAGPELVTAFVALQDIDESMGPTTFMPGTHTDVDAHAALRSPTQKAAMLRNRSFRLGAMPAGACVLYDSRLLHAGGANHAGGRWLLYASFAASRQSMRDLRGKQYEELQRAAYTMAQLEGGDAPGAGESDAELRRLWSALLQKSESVEDLLQFTAPRR